MTTLATDIAAALCAALDAGDDLALIALADLLEERGDPLAVGLRATRRWSDGILHRWDEPRWPLGRGEWRVSIPGRDAVKPWHLPRRFIRRMGEAGGCEYSSEAVGPQLQKGYRPFEQGAQLFVRFQSPSAALLALAEALTDE